MNPPIWALSIKQPWAYAILHLGKDIENRTWNTEFRERFWIHAGKTFDHDGYFWLQKQGFDVPAMSALPKGGIVGSVDLVDCVEYSDSKWFFGPHGLVLRNPEECQFRPYRGQLGWFKVAA